MRIQASAWGCWWCDADLTDAVELTGTVDMEMGGQRFRAAVVSGGAQDGRAAYHLVGGAGGWGSVVPAASYADDMGVKVSTVVSDAARAAGETVEAPPSTRLGPHYSRPELAASHVLNAVCPAAWFVGFDGVTRFGARPTVAFEEDAPRTRVDPRAGIVELAVESLGVLAPGVTVDGSEPAVDVEYTLAGSRILVRLYSGVRQNRIPAALLEILDALDPWRRFRGTWEYRVVTQTGERLNLQPVRLSTGMSDLANVPVRPGCAGVRAHVQLGELVLVAFADGDPSRPQVVNHDAPDAPGFLPIDFTIGDDTALPIARQTDPCVCGPWGGTITVGSTKGKAF